MEASYLLACRKKGERKWHYTSVLNENCYCIDKSLLFLLIREGKVMETINDKDLYCNTAYLLSREGLSTGTNMSEPLTHKQLRIHAIENGIDRIYWITPEGELFESRQKFNPLFLGRNINGALEVRMHLGVWLNEHHKTLVVLNSRQEMELEWEADLRNQIGNYMTCKMKPALTELLRKKGIIGFNDCYFLPRPLRILDNSEFVIEFRRD